MGLKILSKAYPLTQKTTGSAPGAPLRYGRSGIGKIEMNLISRSYPSSHKGWSWPSERSVRDLVPPLAHGRHTMMMRIRIVTDNKCKANRPASKKPRDRRFAICSARRRFSSIIGPGRTRGASALAALEQPPDDAENAEDRREVDIERYVVRAIDADGGEHHNGRKEQAVRHLEQTYPEADKRQVRMTSIRFPIHMLTTNPQKRSVF